MKKGALFLCVSILVVFFYEPCGLSQEIMHSAPELSEEQDAQSSLMTMSIEDLMEVRLQCLFRSNQYYIKKGK